MNRVADNVKQPGVCEAAWCEAALALCGLWLFLGDQALCRLRLFVGKLQGEGG